MLILITFKYVIPPTHLISLHCTLTSGTKAPSAILLRDASLGSRHSIRFGWREPRERRSYKCIYVRRMTVRVTQHTWEHAVINANHASLRLLFRDDCAWFSFLLRSPLRDNVVISSSERVFFLKKIHIIEEHSKHENRDILLVTCVAC